MKALVTGATGFIGGALARRLRSEGHDVRALVRSEAKAVPLRGLGIETAVGDVLHPTSLAEALRGRDVLFHCAALVDLVAPRRKTILNINVQGTRNALEEARKAGVRRVVYLSSVAALGLPDGVVADETVPHPGVYGAPYDESKHRSEQVALQYARGGLDVVLVLPSIVIGPGDPKTGDVIRRLLRQEIPAVPAADGSAGYVHVEDLVDGILLAYRLGRSGERYIFSQANLTHSELLGRISQLSGVPGPRRRIPVFLAAAGATLLALGSRLVGRNPVITGRTVRLATRRLAYSSDKARRELGWRPRDFQERLAETVTWWMKEEALG